MSLTNSQYDALMRAYEQRRIDSMHVITERRNRLFEELPEFRELETRRSDLSLGYAKKRLLGDSSAPEQLKKELQEIAAKKNALLKRHGYPEGYLDPIYTCGDCRDSGFIGNERCHCFKQAAIDLIYTQSNLKGILETENFDHFSFDYYSDTDIDPVTNRTPLSYAMEAKESSLEFIDRFPSGENLLFLGNTGIGKTFLSHCIAKELMDRSFSVLYFSSESFFHRLADNTFHGSGDYMDRENYFYDCDLLIIDDLGTEMTNTFIVSALFACLNERLQRKKSTIISTNLSLNSFMNTYSERVFSRISSNFRMIRLYGADIRYLKKYL